MASGASSGTGGSASAEGAPEPAQTHRIQPPSISLPKGGGAIRGLGEKFAANPVTGTGSMTVPMATSPGRGGFGPQLSLSYDSGSGNGPFGFGWSLALPAISRKTDKGLPRYRDWSADPQDADVFVLSGAEDLVPVLRHGAAGLEIHEDVIDGYRVRRYRPRIEGLFARIERWQWIVSAADPRPEAEQRADGHWRSISKDNILTIYGADANSRIADPEQPERIFSWLICESRDDKGNGIRYLYKAEDGDVQPGQEDPLARAHQRNRGAASDPRRTAQRYPHRILYGPRQPLLDNRGQRPRRLSDLPAPPSDTAAEWLFEVRFDYGELASTDPIGSPEQPWFHRPDAFSSYRSGFEVRTCRRCVRVLMLHHIPDQGATADQPAQAGYEGVVRSTEFIYDDELDPTIASKPIYSFLAQVVQRGWKRENGTITTRSLPPLEFGYSQPVPGEAVAEVDPLSLENLPIGLDGGSYRWVDLHGEGLQGILTEQAGAWFYKRNLSPVSQRLRADGQASVATFAPLETVASQPATGLAAGAQILDLDGNGLPELVAFNGPTPGFYAHDGAEGWEPFRAFHQVPNLDFSDPNLRFIDLDGDGHADLLVSTAEVFVWHRSLEQQGFAAAEQVPLPWDEEQGPRVVFADGTESIHLADMSGDGLADVVRIRCGLQGHEICYWPNLGFGRFGAKVTMDNAPLFDHPELFDPKRLLLADIDGSGSTDLIYMHAEGVRLYFNQAGNSWSAAVPLAVFPPIHNAASVTTLDLLGNGTACLLWSSPLPGDGGRQMRYVPLMAEGKPHLLISSRNNLGAETTVRYAPSTTFALEDWLAGRPWISKLPFPVHVVEQVVVSDRWRQSRFSSRYSYHHGFFDGEEREFRGFGRVEQVDVEEFGHFAAGNQASPYITADQTLYQPPVKTISWFHPGASPDRQRILGQFAREYFAPGGDGFEEPRLPEPDLDALELSAREWREALRACKGMPLRQEVYELEVEALARGEERRTRLFSTAFHNCRIQRLQPVGPNRHGVFLVSESEAISCHYELDLRETPQRPDPRVNHSLNLRIDELGHVLEAVAIAYPRQRVHEDESLPPGAAARITEVQQERHLVFSEHRFTEDAIGVDHHRLRLPCEANTYELTGLAPESGSWFSLAELRRAAIAEAVPMIPYHTSADRRSPRKRLVEQTRQLYFSADLQTPLPLGELHPLGLAYESYRLALTEELLTAVLADRLTPEIREDLATPELSGYLSGEPLRQRFPAANTTGQYWIRSGVAGFSADAATRFFLPDRYRDPFGHTTTLEYEPLLLFPRSTTDPVGNRTEVVRFNHRVLAAEELRDPNGNLAEVAFDGLGMPVALALKGKGEEGDALAGMPLEIEGERLIRFFTGDYDAAEARALLGPATNRHLYGFGEERLADGLLRYGAHPACAAGLAREVHHHQPGGASSPLQAGFEYSDGLGTVLVRKQQAEPEGEGAAEGEGEGLRWIATGKTILNNKGKPVLQYEPYFSPGGHRFEEPMEVGVTPILYYDAAGRQMRTELPDGTVQRVAFTPWWQESWDGADTLLEPGNRWLARRTDPAHPDFARYDTPENRRAARLAVLHANTPAVTHLDSLGREVMAISHNRWERDGAMREEKAVTFSKLDAEGKPLWIEDARGNRVMEYITSPGAEAGYTPCYDMAGNVLAQHSMDGGGRWMVADAAGQPFHGWDANERALEDGSLVLEQRRVHTSYDALRRPLEQRLHLDGGAALVVERFVYGEAHPEAEARNLRGQAWRHDDPSGLVMQQRFDFQGNLLEASRQLSRSHRESVIDWATETPAEEVFSQRTSYDALGRMSRQENWHREGQPPAIYSPRYNQRGVLAGESLTVRGQETQAIRQISYDAKGQRTRIAYGNGTATRYHYDPETFRLLQLRTTRNSPGERLPEPPSLLRNANVLQNLYYTYDPVGNISEILDDAYEPVFFNNQRVEPRNRYSYDALYRLIEASGRENHQATDAPDRAEAEPYAVRFPISDQALRNYSQSYAYDAVGNILEIRHRADGGSWTRQSTYATNSNRLLRSWTGDGRRNAVDVRYDSHGSMLNLANTPEAYGLRWDYRDMIHRVNLGGGGQAFYSYDAGKQRSRKRIEHNGNRVEERLYLGGMEVYRRWLNGSLVEEIETHHLFAGEQRLLIVEDVQLTDNPNLNAGLLHRYQYGNHLGSVSLELTGDEDPQVISYEEYHPYGTTAYRARNAALRATAKRYRYTGMERDEETGLSYHTARYYLPWLGRWGSVDPIGVAAGLNLWSYTNAKSISFADTNGQCEISSEPRLTSAFSAWSSAMRGLGRAGANLIMSLPSLVGLATGNPDTVISEDDYPEPEYQQEQPNETIERPGGPPPDPPERPRSLQERVRRLRQVMQESYERRHGLQRPDIRRPGIVVIEPIQPPPAWVGAGLPPLEELLNPEVIPPPPAWVAGLPPLDELLNPEGRPPPNGAVVAPPTTEELPETTTESEETITTTRPVTDESRRLEESEPDVGTRASDSVPFYPMRPDGQVPIFIFPIFSPLPSFGLPSWLLRLLGISEAGSTSPILLAPTMA
jgi:RHS repeat-associated protein